MEVFSERGQVSRRSLLALMSLPLVGACTRTQDCPPRECGPDTADTVFVVNHSSPQEAAEAARGKNLVFPSAETYTVKSLTIPADCHVQGNGSTLRFPDNSTTTNRQSDEILRVTGSGVTLDGLRFDGNSANQGPTWSQHRHCVRIHGALADTVVRNCQFVNIIGDGVYVNVGTSSNTKIGPGNSFTAGHDNRNGVSIVTGNTVEVFRNTFTHCSRSGMPGPIDIEPNSADEHLTHIDIHDNTIRAGSTTGTGTLPGIIYAGNAAAEDIRIRNNDISGTRLTCGILAIGTDGEPLDAVTGLVISGNDIHDIGNTDKIAVKLDHPVSARVTDNTFTGMQYGIFSHRACLAASTGNTFNDVTTNVVNDASICA
ncbi:hypothetical protein ABZZ79_07510 [Streptomyces sp. NPDC006458]|uniref:right-handed parallel beta-helix repeat-containing protein n=1 Tax=Streptomyces sp. NPDC006458 TaxID=3154302 RepID=UPI0033BDA8C3